MVGQSIQNMRMLGTTLMDGPLFRASSCQDWPSSHSIPRPPRHSAATLLLGYGIHPKIVSERLGHSRIGITLDLYSRVTPTMQKQAVDAMETHLGT